MVRRYLDGCQLQERDQQLRDAPGARRHAKNRLVHGSPHPVGDADWLVSENERREVEADETCFGGLAKNMHRHVKERKIRGTGGSGKEAVLGIVERGGDDRSSRNKTAHVPNVKRRTLAPEIRASVEPGSHVYTDALKSYLGLSDAYTHE